MGANLMGAPDLRPDTHVWAGRRSSAHSRRSQEIQIRTTMSLEHTLGVEPLPAARRQRRWLLPGPATREFGLVDEQVDLALSEAQLDEITVPDQSERSAHDSLW